MDYIMAFLVGGLICAVGQILMDFTPLSPAHILVVFVTLGAILSGLGLYQPLIDLAGAGASVPLPGFGHTLVKGVMEEVNKSGALGILTGGLKATAAGITAAIVFGYIMALIFNPKPK
ncbi:stage V sporulation protein AE [Thermovorax subterraneus]|nr:stage V sporulation protein AE [Thermovorax subterraneus]